MVFFSGAILLRAFLLKSSSGKTLWKTQRNLKKSFCTCLGVYWEIYVCLWVFTGFFYIIRWDESVGACQGLPSDKGILDQRHASSS